MKNKRDNKPNTPDYIDIFADDEDTDVSGSVASLFDEEDESVSFKPSNTKSSSSGIFSKKKKTSRSENRVSAEDGNRIEQKIKSSPKSDESYDADDIDSDEFGDAFEADEPTRKNKHKQGLFSRLFGKADKEKELDYDEDYDEDCEEEYGLEDSDFEDEDDDDGEDENSPERSSSFISWKERDDDEPSPVSEVAETVLEADVEDSEPYPRFSFKSILKNDGEKSGESALSDDSGSDVSSKKHKEKPISSPATPAENKDDDWDIGGDFSDSYPEEEDSEEEDSASEPELRPQDEGFEKYDSDARIFSFDRYGNRRKSAGHSHYGHRKHAKKASTNVITNETDTLREAEEARKRAEKRDIIRDREIKKRKEERRVRILREIKQRLTVAGLLGILLIFILVAAFFAFRVTGISVTGECTHYTAEEIIEMSGLKKGRHILFQDLSSAREKLNADPYLSVTVKYVFPNKINVAVSERRGIGAVQWGPNSEFLALIDKNGYVLETDLSSQGSLPLVKGLVVTRVVAGTKIGDEADEQVQSTLDVLSALDEFGLLYSIKSVDMSETMGISMYTPEGYRIELGNVSDLTTKFSRLKKGWKTIMSTASEQMKKPSVDNVTIYLYAKTGVVVSPHDIGYVDESQVSTATTVVATPVPQENVEQQSEVIFATPEPTPEPEDVIPVFDNEPFTG